MRTIEELQNDIRKQLTDRARTGQIDLHKFEKNHMELQELLGGE